MLVRRCSRSLSRTSCAVSRSSLASRAQVQRTFVASSVVRAEAKTEPKKKDSIEFIVPAEWDLAYLKKFDIPAPTPEQIAKALPPPMEVHGRVGQLASDLFQVSSVYGVLDTIHEELKSVLKLATTTPAFAEFVQSKASKKETRAIFEDVFKTASPVLKKFVARMVENSDFHRLLKMAETYDELIRAYKKEVPVTVAFAKLPSPERLENLKLRIAFLYLPKGASPVWTIHERPELGSGMIVTTAERAFDTSYAKKVADLQERLAGIKTRILSAQPRAMPLPGSLPRGLTPSVFQELAEEVNQMAAARKEAEETEYKTQFVDWV